MTPETRKKWDKTPRAIVAEADYQRRKVIAELLRQVADLEAQDWVEFLWHSGSLTFVSESPLWARVERFAKAQTSYAAGFVEVRFRVTPSRGPGWWTLHARGEDGHVEKHVHSDTLHREFRDLDPVRCASCPEGDADAA